MSANRYAFHDLVRVYARAKSETQDREALRRLLEHLRDTMIAARRMIEDLVETASPYVSPLKSSAEAADWLEAERVNLLRAIAAAVAAGWSELACELAGNAVQFLVRAGCLGDVETSSAAIAETIGSISDTPEKFFVLNALGVANKNLGRYGVAEQLLLRAAEGRQALGDRRMAASSRHNLANVYRLTGRFDDALKLEEAALAVAREHGDRMLERKIVTIGLPNIYQALGRHEEALATLRMSLEMIDSRASPHSVSITHHNIGLCYLSHDDLASAEHHLTQSLAISKPLRSRMMEAHNIGALAMVHSRRGEHEKAIELAEHAHDEYAVVSPSQIAESFADLGEIHAAAGRRESARECFERALSLGRQRGEFAAQARAMAGLGRLLDSPEYMSAAIEIYDRIAPYEAQVMRLREA
ncbi:tetratricopeptide (TPR) repeat protein [Hamadaea flava]|uniref:Tetratricopeptide repeat protein n=1 Tax=Hamadaea flava TaxID=1742688 RepID=A0ABV8LJE2_9ACTN|nr:tetratricopeptide repeat protein [Hamadaea flava]MCP2323533.1 tetratricopeptide (TPR) repeat protein [Hamadaea flava]